VKLQQRSADSHN